MPSIIPKSLLAGCAVVLVLAAGCAFLGLSWDVAWERRVLSSTYDLRCYDMESTSDGGVLIVGEEGNPSLRYWHPFMAFIDAKGNSVLVDTTEGTLRCIRRVPAGGYVAAGAVSSGAWLLRLDENLNVVWSVRYGDSGSDCHGICPTSDGGFIVSGSLSDSAFLLRTDAAGSLTWRRTWHYDEYLGSVGSVIEMPDGGAIVACSRVTFARINCDGETLWTRTYGFGVSDMALTSDGLLVAAGVSDSSYGYPPTDILVCQANVEGETLWTRRHDESKGLWFAGAAADPEGGCVVFGTVVENSSESRILVLKYEATGRLAWSHKWSDASVCCWGTVAADGWLVVAGLEPSAGGMDLVVFKTRP